MNSLLCVFESRLIYLSPFLPTPVEVSCSYILSDNTITFSKGIWVVDAVQSSTAQTAKIIHNTIYGGRTAGINLASSATIDRNLIIDNQLGISVRSKNDNSIITHNTVTRNEKGIATAISSETITNNNLGGNSKFDLSAGYAPVDATNNWWGTTDASAISSKTFDSADDYNFGTVTFSPFLSAPDSQAPSNSYTPIPTPNLTSNPPTSPTPTVPEFPSWIIPILFIITIVPMLLAYFKKKQT